MLRFLPTRRVWRRRPASRGRVLHDELAEVEADVDGRRELEDDEELVAADERVEGPHGGDEAVHGDDAEALLDLLGDLAPRVGIGVAREQLVEVDRHHEQRVRDGGRAEVAPLDRAVERETRHACQPTEWRMRTRAKA